MLRSLLVGCLLRRLLQAGELVGGEIVNGDYALDEVAQLSQVECLGLGQHAFGLGLSDPVAVVEAFHLAFANGALELLVGFFASHDSLEGVIEQAGAIARILGDENVPGEAVAERAWLERGADDLLGLAIARRTARTSRPTACAPMSRSISPTAW